MAQHGDTLDSISYDITQEMLGPTNLLQSKHSSSFNPASSQQLDMSNHVAGSLTFESYNKQHRHAQSSGTWTTLSREAWSDQDEIEDREYFVEEYNLLAKKYNVRLFTPEDYNSDGSSISDKPRTWFSRILRRTSSTHSTKLRAERQLKHKRSISDVTLRRASKTRSTLKDKSLQDLVRLCGLSLLYLPTEYAPCSLAVPTCFRATAQYLVQHGPGVPGVFRIPGSNHVVAALYNHYCTRDEESAVASTVRCPTLPNHINCDVHDVASTFKRFLSGLPGGILGSLALFDAFVSIQNQLHTDPELPAKKQSQIRSKLIALAIATLRSQYRRELICAVFGLLSLIGNATENNRQNQHGEPLPPSDLMGYGPLGILFGPLLIGDLVDNYNLRLPNPFGGLILLPITPPKSRKEKQKERQKSNVSSHDTVMATNIDKIKVVNSITEMLIMHWRDVVSHLKTSQALRVVGRNRSLAEDASKRHLLRPSVSEAFAPHTWDTEHKNQFKPSSADNVLSEHNEIFSPRRRRSKSQPIFGKRLSGMKSTNALSKTVEERASDVSTTPDPSNIHSHTSALPDRRLDDCRPIKSQSTTTSDQDGTGKYPLKRGKSGQKLRNYAGRNQDRVLRLPQKQSTRSLPEKDVFRDEEAQSSSMESASPRVRAGERASQPSENNEQWQHMLCGPGFNASDPESYSRIPNQYSSNSSWPRTRSGTTGANMDHLNRGSLQEDLASLAELARVLLQESQDSETRPHDPSRPNIGKDKDSSNMETTSRNPIARRKESCDSSSSSVQRPLPAPKMSVPKGHESSGSSSLPLSVFLSRRRGGANKQTSSKMALAKPLESTPTVSRVQETHTRGSKSVVKTPEHVPVTGLSKTAALRRGFDSPIRASPRGTVKALVAKFSLGYSPLPVANSATKSSVANVQVNQQSPKGSIVSPYTRNPPSPSRSHKSAISNNQAKETGNPPKVDLQLNSSNKRSSFSTPVSREQFKPSINSKSPSQCAPRLHDRILGRTGESSTDNHGQSSQSGLGIDSDLSMKVPEQVKEACSPQRDILYGQEIFGEPDSAAEAVNPRNPLVPARSNSVLHRQIRSLQQQLAAKTEEVQELRQQLEARSNPDLSTLAENLKEARKETEFWKSRAELYEKQVEMMRKTSGRTSSGQYENGLAKTASGSSTNYSEGGIVVEAKSGRALHGIDGAASWERWSSEKSGRGHLHDFQSLSSTSENGNWLEQTMRALRTTES